jgi:hypothetical protein
MRYVKSQIKHARAKEVATRLEARFDNRLAQYERELDTSRLEYALLSVLSK